MSTPDFIPDDQFVPDAPKAVAQDSGSPDFIPDAQFQPDEEKYGSVGQQVLTAIEGTGKGFAGPIFTGLERGASALGVPGISPEDQAGRAAANPWIHGGAETVGLVAPAVASMGLSSATRAGLEVPGAISAGVNAAKAYSQAGVLGDIGKGAAAAIGLGDKGAGIASRIGSTAVAGAVENALFSAGDVGSKIINGQDPAEAVQTAIPYLGLSAAIGAGIGGGLGGVSELWQATHGPNTGGVLRAVTDKLGGREGGVADDSITKALETVGIQPRPEVLAAMSSDPAIQGMAKALEQSDATSGGRAYQASLQDFHAKAQEAIASTLGKTPEEIAALPAVSKAEAGRALGETAAAEYQAKLAPTIKEFEDLKEKYKDAPLTSDTVIKGVPDFSNPYKNQITPDVHVPGTASHIIDNLRELADHEGWVGGDADVNRELNRVITALPRKQTLGELTDLISQIGNNTKSTLPFGMQTPLSRAGSLIKNVLQDAQDNLAIHRLGDEAPELVQRFQNAKAAFKAQAGLKEALNDRLKIGGSVSGFAKGLKEMARTDGEGVLSRLSGKGDAHLLGFLNDNFPRTAQALKDYHISSLLESAGNKAKAGEQYSITAMQKAVGAMSPELRAFAVPAELSNKLEGMSILQDQLNRVPHNFSNTARTSAVLNKYGVGTAAGMVSMLTGHGVGASLLAGEVAHTLAKTAPDATRLALLKFLGSSQPINSTAFKATVDFIQSAARGENLLTKAASSFFKAGSEVLPASMIPNAASREDLQKSIDYASNPNNALTIGQGLGHYLPDHATAAAAMSQTAVNYFKGLKPVQAKAGPLDSPAPVDKSQLARYNRQLDIAQQPLLALKYCKEGTLRPQDMQTLNVIYPGLGKKLASECFNEMTKALSTGQAVPFKQRQSLSLLIGSPLDSSLTQPALAAVVMSNAPRGAPPQQGGGKKPSKASASSMEKSASLYATPEQSRAQARTAS